MIPVPRPVRCVALGLDAAFLRRVREAGAASGLRLEPVQTVGDPGVAAADALLVAAARGPAGELLAEAIAAGARSIVVCVAQGDAEGVALALEAGADDVVTARALGPEVAARIGAAIARQHRVQVLQAVARFSGDSGARSDPRIVGQSPVIQRLRRMIAQVAGADVPVRIEGETGTGRTNAARFVHSVSSRRHLPLLVVDAARAGAASARNLLFGGAGEECGALRAGHDATVLLRSVDRLDPPTQSLLANWLRTRRIGDGPHAADTSDARLLVTTDGSLDALAGGGRVQPELVAGLSSVRVGLPPLRERRGDAGVLLAHFLRERGQEPPRLSDGARRLLDAHAWPGNVREVQALAALLAARGPFTEIDEAALLPLLAFPLPSSAHRDASASPDTLAGIPTLHDVSFGHIVRVLALAGGVRSRAAKALGISSRTIYNQLGGRTEGGPARRRPATP